MYWSPRHSMRSGRNPSTCEKMRNVVTTRRLLRPVPYCGGRSVTFSPFAISLPLICTTPETFSNRVQNSGSWLTVPVALTVDGLRTTLKWSMSIGSKSTSVTSSIGGMAYHFFPTT